MKTETKNSYLERINKAIAYIESNSTTDIQLKDISIQANLSQYHFHRVFKSITGNTIKDFLTRIRLEKSALKLKHSQNDIGQIAFECGYQNHETFIHFICMNQKMPSFLITIGCHIARKRFCHYTITKY
jgi:AraC family transcriptional regulator